MNNEDNVWRLISKKIAGEASEEELQELQQLLQENPDIQYFVGIMTDLWNPGVQKNEREIERVYDWHMERMTHKAVEKQKAERIAWEKRSKRTESFYSFFNGSGVFKNYFKVIWRNLFRYKGFSLINISGLAIGMASAILILLLVQNELSYEQFHQKKDRIYLLYS